MSLSTINKYVTASRLAAKYGNLHGDKDAADAFWGECEKLAAELEVLRVCRTVSEQEIARKESKKMLMDGIEIKVGDRVYCLIAGFGVVQEAESSAITAAFVDTRRIYFESLAYVRRGGRTLFWDEVKIVPPPKPARMEDLVVDQPIIVWNEVGIEYRRYFKGIREGKVCVFNSGATAWSSDRRVVTWDHWRLPTAEELK